GEKFNPISTSTIDYDIVSYPFSYSVGGSGGKILGGGGGIQILRQYAPTMTTTKITPIKKARTQCPIGNPPWTSDLELSACAF
ncbi:hypothetical protein PMAYCL1PPCAC_27640, partial [Pristionchus mayeri]